MDIIYQKDGIVAVQDINLINPKGKPVSLEMSFVTDTVTVSVLAWDDRNNIGRTYELPMDNQFKSDLAEFFLTKVARIMAENNEEFTGLTLV